VQTLPQLDEIELHTANYGVPLENVFDLQRPKKTLIKKRNPSRSDSCPSVNLQQRLVKVKIKNLYNF
jgi:hypothetical protein